MSVRPESYTTFSGDTRRIEWWEPVAEHHKSELRRVTVHEHDDRNGCETVRGVGFSWRCTCGARGPIQGSRDAALTSKREHERGRRH